MKMIVAKSKITLEEIEKKKQFSSYQELHRYIMGEVAEGRLKPVMASGTNGKKPALYLRYWAVRQEDAEDRAALLEEMDYRLHPSFDLSYYKNHLDQYRRDREMVLCLSDYLLRQKQALSAEMSVNERSFDIFCREKYLDREQGGELLRRLHVQMEDLGFYSTSEPLAYYSHHKNTPQNVLVIENKDTFFTMRKFLENGNQQLLGLPVGTLVYGGGKAVLKRFVDYVQGAEQYFLCPENRIYYFGDLDYEGIRIYEALCEKYQAQAEIRVFATAYIRMFEKAEARGLSRMPATKEGQQTGAFERFASYFDAVMREKLMGFLESRRYIPQEILNAGDL